MKRIRLVLSSLILFSLLVILIIPSSGSLQLTSNVEFDQSQDTSGLVKILNYNTIEQGQNEEWIEVVKAENPDIFIQVETGFIENLEPWKNELNQYFSNEVPYEVVGFDGTSGTDGQAIYSRYPVKSTNVVSTVTLDDGTKHKMNHPYMEAVLDIHGMDVYVFANHLSCCDAFEARMLEQEGLMNYFDTLGDVPIIYGGDFNSGTPEDNGDVSPIQETLGVEPIDMMINASHPKASEIHVFTDTYRALNPDRKGYTLNHLGRWSGNDQFQSRIDYIFVNQHLNNYLVNSSVVTEADYDEVLTASDHKPMLTWMNFNPEIDLVPPLNPVGITLDNVDTTTTTVTWEANTESDLEKYRVYRNGSLISEVPSDTRSFQDTYSEIDTTFIYQVSAVDNNGNEGKKSLAAIAKTTYGELFAPYGVTIASYDINGETGLNWTVTGDSGMELEYIKIYRALDVDDEFRIDIRIDNPSKTGFAVVEIPAEFDLKLKIVVGNSIGETDLSPAVSAVTETDPVTYDQDPNYTNSFQYGHFYDGLVDSSVNLSDSSESTIDDISFYIPSMYLTFGFMVIVQIIIKKQN